MPKLPPVLEPSTIVVHQRDPEELLFFRGPTSACGYLEPVDVEQHEYVAAYDTSGNSLRLVTKLVPRRFFFGLITANAEVVDLVAEPPATSPHLLRDLLCTFLAQRGQQFSGDASLNELLQAALLREGYTGE